MRKYILLWVLLWMITWPGVLADFRADSWKYSIDKTTTISCRKELAFSVAWSALPFAPFIAPFLTGFYEHGFQWSCYEVPK